MRYNKDIVKRICDLISEDSYTVIEICKAVNISKDTYYRWLKKSDFSDAVKKAQDAFNEKIIVEAKRSLMKLVKGEDVVEKRIVRVDTGKKDEQGKKILRVKEHQETVKHFQPNTAAVIFTLTNRDPENWKNRQNTELSGDVSLRSELENLSDEELKNIINDGKK